jgi:CPA1 family monovalent cation:H+ antiporter
VTFLIPYVAYLPVEAMNASGLVSVVVAGLITGHGAPRYVPARHRIAQVQNWRTVELLLEGAIFLIMGLEMSALIADVHAGERGLVRILGVAGMSWLVILAVRGAFIAPLLVGIRRRRESKKAVRGKVQHVLEEVEHGRVPAARPERAGPRRHRRTAEQIGARARHWLADTDYFDKARLGWRDGVVLTWAGMRGVVTLAASQTLPLATPNRSELVVVAFAVAAGSLALQGGTLPWVVRHLHLRSGEANSGEADWVRLESELAKTAESVRDNPKLRRANGKPFSPAALALSRRVQSRSQSDDDEERQKDAALRQEYSELHLIIIRALRDDLAKAGAEGTYGANLLKTKLDQLDADELAEEMRFGGPDLDD